MAVVNATFVSMWDGGVAIRSECKFDDETKLAFDIEVVDVDGVGTLDEQYVELADGTEIRDTDGLKIEGQEDEDEE